MPQIIFSDEADKRLETVCPEYLRGNRKAAQRVEWAIDQLVPRPENGTTQADKLAPTSESGE